ncbi:hypothetical protein, partial [Enterobacter roggenkampii]|uniref:hypothetical protein n=1 Tax=Enterobacter roggenkampii TaxID=1812935 RepID=UPI003B84423C
RDFPLSLLLVLRILPIPDSRFPIPDSRFSIFEFRIESNRHAESRRGSPASRPVASIVAPFDKGGKRPARVSVGSSPWRGGFAFAFAFRSSQSKSKSP